MKQRRNSALAGGREEHRSCVQIWQVTAPANAGERAQKRSKAEPAPEAAGDDAEETPASLVRQPRPCR